MLRRRMICLFAVLALLMGAALAEELPEGLEQAAPEAAALMGEDPLDGYGLLSGLSSLLEEALADLRGRFLAGMQAAAAIMAGVALLGAVESAVGRESIGRYVTTAGALWITAVSAGDVDALIGLGRETVEGLTLFGKTLLPALAAAEAASGGVTAAAVRQVAAVFFSDLLLTAMDRLLLPMVYLYIGTAAAGAVLGGEALERLGELLKKAAGWLLGGLLTLYTGYLAISGAVAGAADAQTVKLAKSTAAAAVPVVGGILAEAAESVLAGAAVLKGTIGAFGALGVIGACLTPFLRLGAQYLLYQGAALVADLAGPKELAGLLRRLSDAFGLVLAITAPPPWRCCWPSYRPCWPWCRGEGRHMKQWLLGVVLTAFAGVLARDLTPKGRQQAMVRLAGGLLLTLAILTPLRGLSAPEALPEGAVELRRRTQELSETYRKDGQRALAAVIEERTQAYILDKADRLGLACRAAVTAAAGESGIPLPDTVTIYGRFSPELAACIEEEVGIPAEKIIWLEE